MGLEKILAQAAVPVLLLNLAASPLIASKSADTTAGQSSKNKFSLLEYAIQKPAPQNFLKWQAEKDIKSSMHRSLLDNVLSNPVISEDEKKMYKDLNRDMTSALRWKGDFLYFEQCTTEVDGKEVYLNIRFEYIHGPRGGSGKTRFLAYLPEEFWYNDMGIENLHFYFFSLNATRLSTKIYEIDLIKYLSLVVYSPLDYKVYETDVVMDKAGEGMRKALKLFGLNKEEVDNLKFSWNVLKTIKDNEEGQKAIADANKMLKDHAYKSEFDYGGYGFLENGCTMNATKLVEGEVDEGEESLLAFKLRYILRRCTENKFGEKNYKNPEKSVCHVLPSVSKGRITWPDTLENATE